VHRALAGEPEGRAGDLAATATHISTTERQSAEAEKDSVQRKKMEFFERQLRSRNPQVFNAVIIDVRSHGLVLELPDVLFTGMIHVSRLPDDFYTFDPVHLQFRGKRNRSVFELGERLEVKVCRVDSFKKQVDFEIAQPQTTSGRKMKPEVKQRNNQKRPGKEQARQKQNPSSAKSGKKARPPKTDEGTRAPKRRRR
jgi:ribonuclease R